MEIISAVNIITAAGVVLLLVLLNRIFRGDLGSNRAGSITAFVVLSIVLYLVRTEGGKAFIDHIMAIIRR